LIADFISKHNEKILADAFSIKKNPISETITDDQGKLQKS